MRISDWSSDVCSSDLLARVVERADRAPIDLVARNPVAEIERRQIDRPGYGRRARRLGLGDLQGDELVGGIGPGDRRHIGCGGRAQFDMIGATVGVDDGLAVLRLAAVRSEEHTSELQSLMRISYAVFC